MNTSDKNNPKKIIGIQFSILSPEEIRRASTVEITNRDTYVNNKPAIGGLFDPRMGVLESGIICPTDGHNFINTPGYFGHINLAKPVFYIQYLSTIIKIMKCVCIKCSKLLIDREKYSYITEKSGDERWNHVYGLCNKIKRCGEDTNNGCGCKQPQKIKKEGLATIIAEWDAIENMSDEEKSKLTLKLNPELVLKIFKRISNEDVDFMGFSSVWSRPDWMICQTMAIPPPAIRPSVKHDSQQRSEDDLTHIIINIIKANRTIQEKIDQNSSNHIIDDWTTVLQYYVATLIDNKIPGVASVAQRSGRPLKSLKERLNGKAGRVRGNLMGKRVDFSARSVITPDPNLSIRELGIPLKIAKNITKPVIVNDRNKKFLLQLIRNGPDVYPGAKIYEKANGESISLRYVDKESIVLENGDRVHRHMMDGDAVLFNRQPTLHRMSMMCHIAKIMARGDTFRMNVADTKPYNADFDGDEMNLHMPQDEEAECELRNLAAVPYQIISPANNKSIVGIFQDSLLGIYRLTRPDIKFDTKTAMNLLMHLKTVDLKTINFNDQEVSSFDLLSQIFPNITLKYKTKRFQDGEEYKTSNNVFELNNGKYVRGQIEKGVLGDGSKGLLQRIYNDYDQFRSSKFVDDLQNIVTEYMKQSGFSVGISDLIADDSTNNRINQTIDDKILEVKNLIDETHLGIFDNQSGKSNEQEFEQRVNNILNRASLEAGKIGRENLDQNNRFVVMVNAGSKGSDLNISQMISCLGQQNVDGKRIPYGFDNRTLPHFTKFDDSPSARGFIENSFIGGLKPEELFFHAMGGRVGLIDTAVKTSQTGYIQRRLIKGLEDLMVTYDFTVRNNQGKIIQYRYGDDCFDPVKVEFQQIPFVYMSLEEIYSHYQFVATKSKEDILNVVYNKSMQARFRKQQADYTKRCKQLIDEVIATRDEMVERVFKNLEVRNVVLPVAFTHIIQNVKGHQAYNIMIDITPQEIMAILDQTYNRLSGYTYVGDNRLFKTLFYFYLSPKELILTHRLCKQSIDLLMVEIELYFKRAIVSPGEMVGMIAAQSIGEPTTQMSEPYDAVKKIVTVKKSGEISHLSVKIGELCDTFIERYPDKTFPTGHPDSVETLLDGLEEDYYIIGVDKEERTHWNRISHFSRHPVNGDLVTIRTKSGRTVTTTLSHSHLCRKDHQVQPINGSDLEVGMRIPVCTHIDNQFIVKTLKIGNQDYILDSVFGWFIGAYLAEGSCNTSENVIAINNNHSHYINQMRDIMTKFGITESSTDTTSHFRHDDLAQFLQDNCGKDSFLKRIPDFIFTAPLECKSAVLQGYMDGDGNINSDKNHHQFRGCSRSEQLIKDISLLFNYFDIFTTLSTSNKNGKPLYHFAIAANYANLYQQHIGSVIMKDRLDGLCEYIARDDIHNVANEIDKIEGLGAIIAECGKQLGLPGHSRNYGRWRNKSSIGRRTLQKYIEIFKREIRGFETTVLVQEMRLLEQAATSNIIWDEIVDIQITTPDSSKYVYDFTVPGNQTFMEANGIIVHNTLNTFHYAGVASKSNVTRGVPRIEEILSLSENPKAPSCTVYLPKNVDKDQEYVKKYINRIEYTRLRDIVDTTEICFDPDDFNTLINEDRETFEQYREFEKMLDECGAEEMLKQEKSKWILRITFNVENMLDKNVTMDDVHYAISIAYKNEISCLYTDYNSDKLVFRLRLNNIGKGKKPITKSLDQSDEIYMLTNFQNDILDNLILHGVKRISKVLLRKITDNLEKVDGSYKKQESWVLDTVGTNLLDILALDFIDPTRTVTNNIVEIHNILGIEAARQAIKNEFSEVIEFDSTYINDHHLSMLVDRMCCNDKMVSIFRHGINNDNIGPIAKASFEETPEIFLKAARHAELDTMKGVSANVMCGQEGYFGTGCFQVVLDLNKMTELAAEERYTHQDNTEFIDKEFGELENTNEFCSIANMSIYSNITDTPGNRFDVDDDYDAGF